MEKYIPYEKLSKKAQRRHNALSRNDWNGVVPVTRSIPNRKKPDRKPIKQILRSEEKL